MLGVKDKSNVYEIIVNEKVSQILFSFGDVMREVQFRNIISSDFIIMFADNFCNFNLHNTIRHHFKAKVELKNVILTSVMQK